MFIGGLNIKRYSIYNKNILVYRDIGKHFDSKNKLEYFKSQWKSDLKD